MHVIVLIAIVVLGGFVNRIRGGLFGSQLHIGTQGARAAFAIIMGIFVSLAFGSWLALVTIIAWGICEFLPNGDYLGMTSFGQFLEATAVGLGNVTLPVVTLSFILNTSHIFIPGDLFLLPMAISGALKGVVYYVANYKLGWWPKGIPGFSAGAEMAEFIFGLVLCLGIAASSILASL